MSHLKAIVRSGITLFFCISWQLGVAQIAPQYYNNTGGTSSNSYPLSSTTNNKAQWIYGPGVFHTNGTTGTPAPAGLITKVYFMIGTSTSATAVYSNFTIKVSQNVGTITAWVDPLFVTGMDTAFYAATYSLVNPVPDGWQQFTLVNPIPYNPALSLAFEICVSAGTGNSVRQQTGSVHQRRYGLYSATSGTTNTSLLNIGFDLVPGNQDVGLEGFVNLPDSICSGPSPVMVTLKNYGPSPLMAAKINWKVNNVAQPVFNWSGNLPVNQTAQVTIGSFNFTLGAPHSILAYTSEPNGGNDTINNNDTVVKQEVHVKPSPGITLGASTLIACAGDSVLVSGLLTGSPPWNLVINDGTVNIPVNNITSPAFGFYYHPTATKTITITSVSDATGCTDLSAPTVLVSVMPPPPATITPQGSTACCMGDSVTLMASIGLNFSYQWYKGTQLLIGDTGFVLHVKTAGDYSVKVMNPNGCSATSSLVSIIVHPLPVVFLGNDTNVVPGASVLLNAGPGFNSYQWSTGATSQTIVVDSSGQGMGIKTIWVMVTDNYYCHGRDTIKINFVNNPGIEEESNMLNFRVYPNPTDGMVRLDFANGVPGSGMIELMTIEGKQVRSFNLTKQKHPVQLDLGNLPEGVYFLRISGEEGAGVTKVVIRH
jgi:hypothetical protein